MVSRIFECRLCCWFSLTAGRGDLGEEPRPHLSGSLFRTGPHLVYVVESKSVRSDEI